MAIRVSQVALENVMHADSVSIRVSQVAAENVFHADFIALRVSQVVWESVLLHSDLTLECAVPSSGIVGVFFSAALTASGGVPPYTFAIIAGELPPGLSLDPATGVISGTPTVDGTFTYVAQVTDAARTVTSVTCSILIAALSPPVSGGGTARRCRVVECHSPQESGCIGWGPLTLSTDQTGVYVVYVDSRRNVRTAQLLSEVDLVQQIAALVTQWERAPYGYNNPGMIRALNGELNKNGRLVAFRTLAAGAAALVEVIKLSLEPQGEVL